MLSHNHDWYFGIHFNYGTDVPSSNQYPTNSVFPPVIGHFLLLDETPFMLLDGTNFLLL